jgi:hypothetical protein
MNRNGSELFFVFLRDFVVGGQKLTTRYQDARED